jgi:uncharacterized protein DUF6090
MALSNSKMKISWLRILGEGFLIVVSVYVAIVLQDLSDRRTKRNEAKEVLGQMLLEMKSDQTILEEVLEEQHMLSRQYSNVDRWLSYSLSDMPYDSIGQALAIIKFTNRTHYPQDAAWRTMVASGELSYLKAPVLVTKLGELFETRNERVDYNGEEYDRLLNNMIHQNMNEIWDPFTKRFFEESEKSIMKFKTQMDFLHITWNEYYIDLMTAYQNELNHRIIDIEEYLNSNN